MIIPSPSAPPKKTIKSESDTTLLFDYKINFYSVWSFLLSSTKKWQLVYCTQQGTYTHHLYSDSFLSTIWYKPWRCSDDAQHSNRISHHKIASIFQRTGFAAIVRSEELQETSKTVCWFSCIFSIHTPPPFNKKSLTCSAITIKQYCSNPTHPQ